MGKLRGQELEHSEKMNSKLLVVLVLVAAVSGQEDDFSCPDDFLGFYPHLYSCDKYWSCEDGLAELRTCGNGLAFIDTDESYKLEQCNELHLVDCGARTEIEPPISTNNCPGLYGTFPDPADCRQYFLCINGVPREQGCPLGEVFNAGSGSGEDGQCTDPEIVPECANYYSDNELDQHRFETTRQDNNN